MHTLPIRHAPRSSGKRPAKRRDTPAASIRKLISGLVMSAAAIVIILFSLGYFPQVNAFFSNANATVQSHNDEAVRFILNAAPYAVFTAGVLGLTLLLVNAFRKRSRNSKPATGN